MDSPSSCIGEQARNAGWHGSFGPPGQAETASPDTFVHRDVPSGFGECNDAPAVIESVTRVPDSLQRQNGRPRRQHDSEWCSEIAELAAQGLFEPPCPQPAQLTDYLFLGGVGEACRVEALQKLGIHAVVNMAPRACREAGHEDYTVYDGLILLKQEAADHYRYPLLELHLRAVEDFIERHKAAGRRILIHCYAGMNRSAAICAALLMRRERMSISDAVRLIAERRGRVLTNDAFILQLVSLAREENLLH